VTASSARVDPDEVRYRNEFASVRSALDARPKLVVDLDLEVLWCCEQSPILLRRPMPLVLSEGKLAVGDEELGTELADFLGSVDTRVTRKLIRGKAKPHWVVMRAWKPSRLERAVCLVCSPSLPVRDVVESGLAEELKLTSAEVRVLREFAELKAPKDIARRLGVSLSTVRSHLKAIHAKAFVTTSTQLLRLIYTFCSD
jgi:DNA-binding CsgD family transcriptional regulator